MTIAKLKTELKEIKKLIDAMGVGRRRPVIITFSDVVSGNIPEGQPAVIDFSELWPADKTRIEVSEHMMAYDDGLVPDITDRDLADWELFKGNPDIVTLDPVLEFALRQGLTTQRHNCNVAPSPDNWDRDAVPRPPADKCLPWEMYKLWEAEQIKLFEAQFET